MDLLILYKKITINELTEEVVVSRVFNLSLRFYKPKRLTRKKVICLCCISLYVVETPKASIKDHETPCPLPDFIR